VPHTYVDDADNTLTITARPGPRLVTRTTIPTEDDQDVIEHVASVTAPKGADAVELARAILAAAGDTGHMVVSIQDSERTIRIRESIAAETMRDRAAETAYHDLSTENAEMADAIRALPLLPAETAREPLTADTDA